LKTTSDDKVITDHGKRSDRIGQHVVVHLRQDGTSSTDKLKGSVGLDDSAIGGAKGAQDNLRLLLDDLVLCLEVLDDG
jgi:hypothetical protein